MQSVPVMGAIMLNPALDKCLLVKSWGSNGAWGFPRGKISKDEADADCARREVRTLVQRSVDNT
jgi:mRNA-decapping enzyme subunit 2